VQARLEELRGMRLRDLRRELTSLGLRTEGRVDRESLLELLEAEGVTALLRARRAAREPYKGYSPTLEHIPKMPACSPQSGSAEVPIYMMHSVDQYGVKAGSTRVITLDLECGIATEPTRFVLDTVSEHSLIKAKVAERIGAEDKGVPDWARGADASLNIRKVGLKTGWLGMLNCGELEVASIVGKLPVPLGTAGILGLDFLRLFDWDFNFTRGCAAVTTAPKDGLGPVPFNLNGMRMVPLTPVRTPVELLACPIKMRVPTPDGQGTAVDCMGIADLGAACSMCSQETAHKLGLAGPAKPYSPKRPQKKQKKEGRGFGAAAPEPAFQEQLLEVDIGVGPDGPVKVKTPVSFGDIEVFENMGLAYNWPAAILGPDALCRSRLILSPRLKSLWLPASG